MSYRFNSLSGKLVKSAQSLAKGIKPPKEDTEIIYGIPGTKFAKVPSAVVRSAGDGQYGRVPDKLLAKYRHFQKDDGTPIHLKGGTTDRVLYYSTLALTAYGLTECFRFYYFMAFPRKLDE